MYSHPRFLERRRKMLMRHYLLHHFLECLLGFLFTKPTSEEVLIHSRNFIWSSLKTFVTSRIMDDFSIGFFLRPQSLRRNSALLFMIFPL